MEEYDIPNHSFYKYLQIRHALNTQFEKQGPIWSNSPIYQKIGRSGGSGGFIAKIYPYICRGSIEGPERLRSRSKWEEDLGTVSDEQWKKLLERGHLVSVSPAHKVSYLMLLHRTYYTPKRLFEFGWRVDARCPRCQDTGDLIHMIWKCPKLFRYWSEILP